MFSEEIIYEYHSKTNRIILLKSFKIIQDIPFNISGESSMYEENETSEYNKENTLDNNISSSDKELGE